jgi:hypothetical protein
MKHSSESRWLHVLHRDRWHPGVCHGTKELRFEDRRAGSEHGTVSRERLAVDEERHVRADCAVQQAAEMEPDARQWRHRPGKILSAIKFR